MTTNFHQGPRSSQTRSSSSSEFLTSWTFYPDWSVADLRRYLESCVEIINHSIAGLPEELVRFHTCWGSGHRPHVNDIELKHIADLIIKINA